MTGGPPTLLIVAHGSRDARHAATVDALAARVRARAPGVPVAHGFLDFAAPRVETVLARLHAAGRRRVVALPLLLNRAYHATTDIPAVLAAEQARLPGLRVRQTEVLGPDPLLFSALERRLAEADPGTRVGRSDTGVVLASAGTSDPAARAALERFAARWRASAGWGAVVSGYASAHAPDPAQAVRALRAAGLGRVVVSPYVIAPGRLPDRIAAGAREAGSDVLAPVLGAAPELAELLLRRYAGARRLRRAPALVG
ncbi:sirohydrochlorin chelatase [Streptomyces sp. NBRC 109706]|uniref:sirohydrochlorin chelatase n=1 Tax=Streptomyces sp. NBRC 109706 TaxID=1550035 RepID=UPI000784A858|nr:sirohydrochlorin chelatase [Streptomyces sp. NBRC 109706]